MFRITSDEAKELHGVIRYFCDMINKRKRAIKCYANGYVLYFRTVTVNITMINFPSNNNYSYC